MNTWSNVSMKWRAVRSPAVFGAAMALTACGGGGVTNPPADDGGPSVNATPYTLFASNYVVYASQTNNAFLHSVQGGDVYAKFGGNINYGCYSFPQSQMDATQLYAIQAQADSNGGPPNGSNCQPNSNVPPTTATDFAQVTIKAPGTNSPTAPSVTPLDISQSDTLLIQMGNIYTQGDVAGAIGGNATVYTVELNNDTSANGDGSAQTALCSFDQTLGTIGRGAAAPLGVLNYVIPFSSFSCSKGTMDTMKSTGVTSITVRFSGDKNPNLKVNEFDVIAVGYVGFSK